jgi:hypothetical protein
MPKFSARLQKRVEALGVDSQRGVQRGRLPSGVTPEDLLDPGFVVEAFGKVVDQASEEVVPYSSDAVAPSLQRGILDFVSRSPKDKDGYNKWLVVLASRQTTKSTTAALAIYAKTAYSPGMYSAIMADTKERAEDLFRHISLAHENMPPGVQSPTITNKESRQLSFEHGGKVRTLSAGAGNVGIGRGTGALQISEAPFWENPEDVWFKLSPAFRNRKEALVLMESTPAPMSEPGAEWYRDICASARVGDGRMVFLFAPFFQSRLNERTWDWASVFTMEELRLLDRFGPQREDQPLSAPGSSYLTVENLAFRRAVMAEDVVIRRYPEMFFVFYPTDPVTAWQRSGSGAIPPHALDRFDPRNMQTWSPMDGALMEYVPPKPRAAYVIGVDPAGFGTGDQASFQVLEVWADAWEQVATFSSNELDPAKVAIYIMRVAKRYNDALVIVESNGVGAGVLSLLSLAQSKSGVSLPSESGQEQFHIENLYHDKIGDGASPGIAAGKQTNARGLATLIDALMDKLTLHDVETVAQLQSYKRDKEVEPGEAGRLIDPGRGPGKRRAKHHWDRVSALIWACVAATKAPVRLRPLSQAEQAAAELRATELRSTAYSLWSGEDQKAWRDAENRRAEKSKKGYRPTRYR